MLYKIKYFGLREIACKCGCGYADIAAPLVLTLELIRRAWGQPIYITSGCRCKAHNLHVGGAAASRHMAGLAADIRPRDLAMMPALVSLVRACLADTSGWELLPSLAYIHMALPRGAYDIWRGQPLHITVR